MSERWHRQGWQHWGPGLAVTAGKGYEPTGKGNGGEGKGDNGYEARQGKDNGGGYVPTGKGNGGEGKGVNGYEARLGKDNGGKGTAAGCLEGMQRRQGHGKGGKCKENAEASKVLSQQGIPTIASANAMSQLAKAKQSKVFKLG